MKTILKHPLGWAATRRRFLVLLFVFTVGLVLLAHPGALAADVLTILVLRRSSRLAGGWDATRSNTTRWISISRRSLWVSQAGSIPLV